MTRDVPAMQTFGTGARSGAGRWGPASDALGGVQGTPPSKR